MKPSEEIIETFRKIYFEEFGEKISNEEAYNRFLRLVNFLRVILKPLPSDKYPDKPEFDQNHMSDKLEPK